MCTAFKEKFSKSLGDDSDGDDQDIPNTGRFSELEITKNDVLKVLMEVKAKKSKGPSKIENFLLKKYAGHFAPGFYKLINSIRTHKRIPDKMRVSSSVPILKFGKATNKLDSFRLVTLSDCYTRTLDKILYEKMMKTCTNENLIRSDQYGFIPGSSPELQLVDLTKVIYEGLDKGAKFVDVVFFDLSDAFNTVPTGALLKALEKLGFGGEYLSLTRDLLTNRRQYIHFGGNRSDEFEVKKGVKQGGFQSPLLFNIYLDEVTCAIIYALIFKFADDMALVKAIFTETDIEEMQCDITSVGKFCDKKELKINPAKTEHLRIYLRNKSTMGGYEIQGVPIKQVSYHKHLGVILDEKMNFDKHTACTLSKARQKWAFLQRNIKGAGPDTYTRMYKSYILPVLEFANIIWNSGTVNEGKVENFQAGCLKTIAKIKGIEIEYAERCKIFGIKSIRERKEEKLTMIGKNITQNSPLISAHWKNQCTVRRCPRKGNTLYYPVSRTKKADQYALRQVCRTFNGQDIEIRGKIT